MHPFLAAIGRLFGVLFLPDRALPSVVTRGRSAAALLAITGAALLAALAAGERLDVSAQVYAMSEPPPGEAPKSSRELEEDIAKARAVERVKLGLAAGLGTPVQLLILGVAVYGIARFVGGRPTFDRSLALATHAALPVAVKAVIATLAAMQAVVLAPEAVPGLVAYPEAFLVWSAVLLAVGLPAAANVTRTKAIITVAVCFFAYLAVTRLILGARS